MADDKVRRDKLRPTGVKSKRAAVDQGLRGLLQLRRQAEIRRLRGKLDWQGDFSAMRSDGRFWSIQRAVTCSDGRPARRLLTKAALSVYSRGFR